MQIKEDYKSVVQNNKIIRFNDNINNLINKNNEIFSEIVNVTKLVLQREKVIDYTKCKKTIDEIENELNFLKSDFFDL